MDEIYGPDYFSQWRTQYAQGAQLRVTPGTFRSIPPRWKNRLGNKNMKSTVMISDLLTTFVLIILTHLPLAPHEVKISSL